MSQLYGAQHRALQDKFETRKLADAVENVIVQTEITPQDKAFIESRDMFFLSTVDHLGRPSVSYKGGDVPKVSQETPLPDWKRLDKIQDILPPKDRGKAARHGGVISIEELQDIAQTTVDRAAQSGATAR